ncbi:MAG: hypothetical protein JWO36_3414 [Myxococcales bacterium]|nr:hypothetical protein [Myxococcales bacterium]
MLAALDTIRTFARTDPDRSQDVLQTVEVMLASLQDALTGKTSPDMLAAELAALVDVHGRAVSKRFLTPIDERFDPGVDDDSSPR